MGRIHLLLAALLSLLSAVPAAAGPARTQVVILVSIDGFRADYLDRGVTPNLSALTDTHSAQDITPSAVKTMRSCES
ncbi:alkaline phosphatase family protein [Novosphingobium album (ex Hu et al. 2023)]|uniref:alkaline phosphatase family protein n=1 Tax=Novosphingobium album (ex Hu et al. 2023) TaxID=2930093 RepID=UPI003AF2E108